MANISMDPGALRHRLVLEQQVETPDGCGGFSSSWQAVATIWAAIMPRSSAQTARTQTLNAQTEYQINLRWRDDCLPQMRLVKAGRIFIINSVLDPDETKRYLHCACEELK